jgi:signal transduction histidine kinase
VKRTSLTEKMVLYFLALGIGSIVITGIFSFFTARKALLERTYNQLTSLRLARETLLENYFSDRLREIEYCASSPEVKRLTVNLVSHDFNGSNLTDSIGLPLYASVYYSGLMILDKSGKLLYNNNQDHKSTESRIVFDGRHLINNSPKAFVVDHPSSEPTDTNYLFTAGAIIIKGEIIAYIALQLRPELIYDFMLDANPSNGLGYSGETYLVGDDYLMRSPSRFIHGSVMKTRVMTLPVTRALKNETGIAQVLDYRGIEVLSSYGQVNIAGLNWALIAEIDYKEATASIYAIRNNILLLTVFTALAFFIITYMISRKITRPLIKLKNAAVDLGEGRLNTPVGIESDDEIGELTEAFNRMSINLHEKDIALKEERGNRLRSAIDGQDQERQRLSRELHDGIGQSMIAIRLRLGALENVVPEKIKQNIQTAISLTDSLIDDVRAISNALMPPSLAEFGLTAAISNLCNNLTESFGIKTELVGEIPGQIPGRKARLYIFRIFQEALNNVAKHSEAKTLKIVSVAKESLLYISISDDGKGFDQDSSCVSKGHGLNNIIERASLLKGKASIKSSPGNGTQIEIEIPLNKNMA